MWLSGVRSSWLNEGRELASERSVLMEKPYPVNSLLGCAPMRFITCTILLPYSYSKSHRCSDFLKSLRILTRQVFLRHKFAHESHAFLLCVEKLIAVKARNSKGGFRYTSCEQTCMAKGSIAAIDMTETRMFAYIQNPHWVFRGGIKIDNTMYRIKGCVKNRFGFWESSRKIDNSPGIRNNVSDNTPILDHFHVYWHIKLLLRCANTQHHYYKHGAALTQMFYSGACWCLKNWRDDQRCES